MWHEMQPAFRDPREKRRKRTKKFNANMGKQVALCTHRQFLVTMRDKKVTIGNWIRTCITALVTSHPLSSWSD